jgi:mono/diheme cytochrome c family protein
MKSVDAIEPSGMAFITDRWHPEPVSRTQQLIVDVRPITFSGNKVVVADGRHPRRGRTSTRSAGSSSWPPTPTSASSTWATRFDDKAGLRTFQETCAFCHGARGVGATMGWDFVDPVVLYTYRGPRQLLRHLRLRPLDAPSRGLLMPAFSHLSEAEVRQLWRWLEQVALRDVKPYTPRPRHRSEHASTSPRPCP